MLSMAKPIFHVVYPSSLYQFVCILFCALFSLPFTISETCVLKSPCQCVFQNGSIIDLSSIGDDKKARFENIQPQRNESYTYYYNPCYSFQLGPEGTGCHDGVAVCQVSKTKEYYNCGNQGSVNFNTDNAKGFLQLIYSASQRTTNVTLICSRDALDPKLEVKGEVRTNLYVMTLTSRCACPDLCSESHLSPGSVLVIIFMIFVSLYLVLGIIHSSLTRGAHGWELIPHYEFWADFPLLVRDGCVFVISGCKPETAYERI